MARPDAPGIEDQEVDEPRRRPGRPAVGRQTSLTAEDILTTTYRIISDEGLDALTMKRLADDLGVTVKALYNHVPSKPVLLQLLVDRIWGDIFERVSPQPDDLVEWIIQLQLVVRRVWLDHLDLATLAMAVTPPSEDLMSAVTISAAVAGAMGAPDAGFFYNVLQTYTFGSIAVAANRRRSSAYFGRDPETTLAEAYVLADKVGLSPEARAVLEARWDEGDEKHFEAGLRFIVAALLSVGSETRT